jgi:NADP-dependent 3-hydroxy acid dehydrogenase YdfG
MINEFHPDIIISSGCAGGNGDDINIQDVVVSAELAYHDVYCGKAIDDTTIYGQVQGMPVRFKGDEERAAKLYKGITPLTGNDIADVAVYAANAPEHVQIAEVLILATHQASGSVIVRK